jgi:hypothetical protein
MNFGRECHHCFNWFNEYPGVSPPEKFSDDINYFFNKKGKFSDLSDTEDILKKI